MARKPARLIGKVFAGVLGVVTVGGVGAAFAVSQAEPTIRANVFVGQVPLGGLTRTEAARRLRIWWEGERVIPITLRSARLDRPIAPRTPGALGVFLDDRATVAGLPLEQLWGTIHRRVTGEVPARSVYPVQYRLEPPRLKELATWVQASARADTPARAFLENGSIRHQFESRGMQLAAPEKVHEAVIAGIESRQAVELPLDLAPQRITDDQVRSIRTVMRSFSTRFPRGQVDRNNNIRVAATKLNGHILLPGERISFNETVGKRTVGEGFREATVFVNGRREQGVGGGICQVSTTLYNAALLSDLKIVRRTNHSRPVAYVPLGRDAAVAYGSLDLILENDRDHPVAISAQVSAGQITFSILGPSKPTYEVRLISSVLRSWSRGVEYQNDPSLPPGAQRVRDRGASGRVVRTYRVIYENGREVRRERIGDSNYRGAPTLVAINRSAPRPASEPQSPAGNDDATTGAPATGPALPENEG